MAIEMTIEEYNDKHSIFTDLERMENRKRERSLLLDYGALLKFWQDKREVFKERLMMRGSE